MNFVSHKKTEISRSIGDWLFVVLLLLLIALVFSTFDDYGLSTDEPTQQFSGQAIYKYYAYGFENRLAQHLHGDNARFYGGAVDLTSVILQKISEKILKLELDSYDVAHFTYALFGLAGIVAAFLLGRWIYGPLAGFFSALFLALIPSYYGPMYMNPKDIPFAAMYILSLYFGLRVIFSLPKGNWIWTLGFGLSLGVLMGIKSAGGVVGFYIVVGLFLLLAKKWPTFTEQISIVTLAGRIAFKQVFPTLIIAWLVMLAFWPWAWLDPIINPIKAVIGFSNFTLWQNTVMVFGKVFQWDEIPWYYSISYFVFQLPEFILVFLALGSGLLIFKWRELNDRIKITIVVMLLSTFLLPIFGILNHSVVYGALRHFSFVLPMLAVFSGITASYILYRLHRRHIFIKIMIIGSISTLALNQALVMQKLHPYEYIYFNRLIGGFSGAHATMESDYWSTAYREAAEKLVEYVASERRDSSKNTIKKVFVCQHPENAFHYFSPQLKYVKNVEEADFLIVGIQRKCLFELTDGEVIAKVEREGKPLALVRKIVH